MLFSRNTISKIEQFKDLHRCLDIDYSARFVFQIDPPVLIAGPNDDTITHEQLCQQLGVPTYPPANLIAGNYTTHPGFMDMLIDPSGSTTFGVGAKEGTLVANYIQTLPGSTGVHIEFR